MEPETTEVSTLHARITDLEARVETMRKALTTIERKVGNYADWHCPDSTSLRGVLELVHTVLETVQPIPEDKAPEKAPDEKANS